LSGVSKEQRVGFILDPQSWLGGQNYFRNLLIAIARLPEPKLVPVIFTSRGNRTAVSGLPPFEIVPTSMMDRGSLPWLVRKCIGKSFLGDVCLERVLRQSGISVLSHSRPLVSNSKIASIGWIPDFQHVHLPEFFSAKERHTRDHEFMEICSKSNKIIVSSNCALADLRAFAPPHAAKAEVLQFVASPPRQSNESSLAVLQMRYKFDGRFFVLPNQFWAHKNHRVVIEALMLLKQRNRKVTVLATGSTWDHRQPGFFDSLMKYVDELGVRDQFRVLGVIPFVELAELMRSAVALINPSKFEGWSTSVEEAKSMGKQIILSDIPVHREQAPSRGIYFAATDSARLSEILWNTVSEFDERADIDAQKGALLELTARQLGFAINYQRIVLSLAPGAERQP
jgi:glycosyltransferase involved in cell wall biosynthesis